MGRDRVACRLALTAVCQMSIRGRGRPRFQCGERGPIRKAELERSSQTRGHSLMRGRGHRGIDGGEDSCSSARQPHRVNQPQAIVADGRVGERADFDPELRHVEDGVIAEHREHDAAEPMRDRDNGHLMTALRTQPREVRVQRVARPRGLMGRLAEHEAERARAALRDVPVHVPRARLVRR